MAVAYNFRYLQRSHEFKVVAGLGGFFCHARDAHRPLDAVYRQLQRLCMFYVYAYFEIGTSHA